jgi:hypothetical protein
MPGVVAMCPSLRVLAASISGDKGAQVVFPRPPPAAKHTPARWIILRLQARVGACIVINRRPREFPKEGEGELLPLMWMGISEIGTSYAGVTSVVPSSGTATSPARFGGGEWWQGPEKTRKPTGCPSITLAQQMTQTNT